eukprot:15481906-Alexandrium_andersonii.AAC.1
MAAGAVGPDSHPPRGAARRRLGKVALQGAVERARPLAVTDPCPGPAPGGSGLSPGRTPLRSFTRRRQSMLLEEAAPAAAQGVTRTPKPEEGPAVASRDGGTAVSGGWIRLWRGS